VTGFLPLPDTHYPPPEALAELHAACFVTPRPWTAAEFAGLMAQGQVFLIGLPEGMALGRMAGPEAELLTLAVHPAARGRGHGRALLGAFVDQAVARGAQDAYLEVASDNQVAISLYVTEGFQELGRRRGYFRSPDGGRLDALVMHKALAHGAGGPDAAGLHTES